MAALFFPESTFGRHPGVVPSVSTRALPGPGSSAGRKTPRSPCFSPKRRGAHGRFESSGCSAGALYGQCSGPLKGFVGEPGLSKFMVRVKRGEGRWVLGDGRGSRAVHALATTLQYIREKVQKHMLGRRWGSRAGSSITVRPTPWGTPGRWVSSKGLRSRAVFPHCPPLRFGVGGPHEQSPLVSASGSDDRDRKLA